MEEVDIEAEDFNELESRLYSQIHHGIPESPTGDLTKIYQVGHQSEKNEESSAERIVTEKSIVNLHMKSSTLSAKRYWGKNVRSSEISDALSKSATSCGKTQNLTKISDVKTVTKDGSLQEHGESINCVKFSSEKETQSVKNIKDELKEPQLKNKITTSRDLRINPAAVILISEPKLRKKKNIQHAARYGPFDLQENKLQKVLKVRAKKQKSKRVRNKKRKELYQEQTIVLDSSNSSDDDVVLIPAKPPLTITVSDSDNEDNRFESCGPQLEEENAMDASDIALDSKQHPIDFIKPTDTHNNTSYETNEKRTDPALSRCTSPCSVLSSDDFIGQSDRCRLEEGSFIADDQDLVLLTADVDSLIHTAKLQPDNVNKHRIASNASSTEDVMCTAEFSAPLSNSFSLKETMSSNSLDQRGKYRVEQTDFRALDVYESESDVADSVYSKGKRCVRTIVNAICSSSDADEGQKPPSNQKIKRFSKRRNSTCNRSSVELRSYASTDDEGHGVPTTSVPFILYGSAVERSSTKRTRSQSLNLRRVSTSAEDRTGNMSDTEFIATLNRLVQVCKDVPNKDMGKNINEVNLGENDVTEESKSLVQENKSISETLRIVETEKESLRSVQYQSEAVPDEAMAGLDRIFASIDNLAEPEVEMTSKDVESCSDDDVEVLNQTSPTINVVKYTDNRNVLPIRHIVYNDRNPSSGGIGWNEEMIKFYNLSWHGERFTLVGAQNLMEKDRKLWKISNEDKFPKTRPYSNLKCFNCCEFGHTRAKCRRPKKTPVCYMCGECGHFEPRCPNTMCLRCGNKTQVYTKGCNACTFQNRLICPICKVRGHSINLCPDKWRRYHSTTQPNAHPVCRLEFNKRKMCCICGGIGHLSDTCRSAVRFMEYPVIVSHVKSHQKSYNDISFKSPCIGLALNLLYRPRDTVIFRMAEKTGSNGYYARFMKSVGLGCLLKRKRPNYYFPPSEKPAKQARSGTVEYKQNLYCPAAREGIQPADITNCEIVTGEKGPNQVQEVSGSVVSIEDTSHGQSNSLAEEGANESGIYKKAEVEIVDKKLINENNFKVPNDIPTTIISQQLIQNKDCLTADSDSNYSFSDHFEVSRSDVNRDQIVIAVEKPEAELLSTTLLVNQTPAASRVREMEPLPDFIPLSSINAFNVNDNPDNFDPQAGISRRFVAAYSDDENGEEKEEESPNKACEAKIYLTNFHSNYLLSPEGHNFLVRKSKDCNIKARLDWTSVGHVLVIFGFPNDQDTFHKALLVKSHELMNEINDKQSNGIKVPKRVDALIRFLRENISQLQGDLGDVNDLQQRIKSLERTNTKSNMKIAEKNRRVLNMILLGQAGLCDGDKHLSRLLDNLKSLINDYQIDNLVPQSLREEIDCHSKPL
ncbi:uncharacterized protein LOC101450716 isoform X2 [Ceratitis capitata]|uniref:uncharacterized protein LOC101450716 isoform X2 n=1 Tax=Ceratitis capitata TaxID=7213 RepID=UPI000A0FF676|nr:uncharacterized protein LOC101450716 isoform X2 [Ceratitis capitata]